MSESDVSTLKTACEALSQVVQEFSTKLYQQAGVDPNNMNMGGQSADDDIIDG